MTERTSMHDDRREDSPPGGSSLPDDSLDEAIRDAALDAVDVRTGQRNLTRVFCEHAKASRARDQELSANDKRHEAALDAMRVDVLGAVDDLRVDVMREFAKLGEHRKSISNEVERHKRTLADFGKQLSVLAKRWGWVSLLLACLPAVARIMWNAAGLLF